MSENKPHARDRRLFICGVRDKPQTLHELVSQLDFKSWRLSAWLKQPDFQNELHDAMRILRRRRRLTMELALSAALHLLARAIAGEEVTPIQIEGARALFDVRFAASRHATRSEGPSARAAARKAARSLVHPDISPEEAIQHIEALERREGAD